MERPTKEIAIGDARIVIKTYLTAGERRAINAVIYQKAEVVMDGTSPTMGALTGDVVLAMQDELVRQAVVSVNGSREGVYEACMAMPEADFALLEAEIALASTPDPKKKS
jgi:hypothetical protein